MSLTAMIAMAMTMAAADPVDTARKEFNDCLTKFTNESLDAKKAQSDFTKESASACSAGEGGGEGRPHPRGEAQTPVPFHPICEQAEDLGLDTD